MTPSPDDMPDATQQLAQTGSTSASNSRTPPPGRALAAFRGAADHAAPDPRRVAVALDPGIAPGAEDVAEAGEQLEQERGRVGLGLRLQPAHDVADDAVIGVLAERIGPGLGGHWLGLGVRSRRRVGARSRGPVSSPGCGGGSCAGPQLGSRKPGSVRLARCTRAPLSVRFGGDLAKCAHCAVVPPCALPDLPDQRCQALKPAAEPSDAAKNASPTLIHSARGSSSLGIASARASRSGSVSSGS